MELASRSQCCEFSARWYPQRIFTRKSGRIGGRHCPSHSPNEVDLNRTPCPQTLDLTRRPRRRQRRKQINHASVTLHQHLGDRRSRAKVSINLKDRSLPRRMSVEQVQIRAVLHQHPQRLPRLIAIAQSRPEAIAQARLQPVYAPPLANRRSREIRAAFANSGVPRGVISLPGYSG